MIYIDNYNIGYNYSFFNYNIGYNYSFLIIIGYNYSFLIIT